MADKKSNDSIGKTLLVVLVLCLVCSIVVAGSAVGLKSRQQEQRALDKQRNILAVAGLMQQGMDADAVAETFAARITLGWSIWRPANCWIKTRANLIRLRR